MSTLGRTSVMGKSKDTIEVTRLKARLRWLLKERESHEKEIKEHCLKQLAKFKVPNTIKIVENIPKGATGKLQRNKMAKLLGLE